VWVLAVGDVSRRVWPWFSAPSLGTILVCFFANCKVGDDLDGYLYVCSWQIEIAISSLYKSTMGNWIYVDIASVWYDHVDSSTWSPIMLENLMEEIVIMRLCQ
jgi:hypothetical protein